jgi:hypothetical protein
MNQHQKNSIEKKRKISCLLQDRASRFYSNGKWLMSKQMINENDIFILQKHRANLPFGRSKLIEPKVGYFEQEKAE